MAAVEKAKKAAEERLEAAKALPVAYLREVFPARLEDLPDGWTRVKLGDVCSDISYGLSDRLNPNDGPQDGARILTISNVRQDGTLEMSVERYSSAPIEKRRGAMLRNHDLLYNWRNGSIGHLGKTAIWENQLEGEVLHVSFLLRLRCDTDSLNPFYLWAYLNNLRNRGYYENLARMQVNVKFNATELGALFIPLPPLPEQTRIAETLNDQRRSVQHMTRLVEQEMDILQAIPPSLLRLAFSGGL